MKISCEEGSEANYSIFAQAFEGMLVEIGKKIRRDLSSIEFVIYDALADDLIKKLKPSCLVSDQSPYGYYDPQTRKIYISSRVIRQASMHTELSKMTKHASSMFPALSKHVSKHTVGEHINTANDLFVAVILDELAHYYSGKNHGNAVYNKVHNELKGLYNA